MDSLPLSKSSSSCFLPILGYICNPCFKPYVFLIGLYWGKDKPLNCNDFLLDLVDELKYLYENGFQTKNGIKRVVVDTFCCDLPAKSFKSFILKTKSHTGFFHVQDVRLKVFILNIKFVFLVLILPKELT